MLSPDVAGGASPRTFDFSKFPTLQEVNFELCWVDEGIFWIPTALSTFTPATSPRISAIRLNLGSYSASDRPVPALLKATGRELLRVADEFTRIKREYKGAVNLTVVRNPGFEAVSDTFNVRSRFCGVNSVYPANLLIHSLQILRKYTG